jgi:hypothetical protein
MFLWVRGRRQRWRREEETGVAATVEETDLSSVNGGGGDQWSRERWGFREFWDKSEMIWGTLLFFGSEILVAVIN